MTDDKKMNDLIEATIDLADAARTDGKLTKHAEPLPDGNNMGATTEWCLGMFEDIAEEIERCRSRLRNVAEMVADGDTDVCYVAENILRDLGPVSHTEQQGDKQ